MTIHEAQYRECTSTLPGCSTARCNTNTEFTVGSQSHRALSQGKIDGVMTPQVVAPPASTPFPHTHDAYDEDFYMFHYKVTLCPYQDTVHEWKECPYAHPGEKANRRNPLTRSYMPIPCPDYRKGVCKRGDPCPWAHGVFECWLHPLKFRTLLCRDGAACHRRMCFFAHSTDELRAPPPLELALTNATPTDVLLQQQDLVSRVLNTTTNPIPIVSGGPLAPTTPPAVTPSLPVGITHSHVLGVASAGAHTSSWTPLGGSCPWPTTPLASAATPSSSMSEMASLSRTGSTLEGDGGSTPVDSMGLQLSSTAGGHAHGGSGGMVHSYSCNLFPRSNSGIFGDAVQHVQQHQQRSLQQILHQLHVASTSGGRL